MTDVSVASAKPLTGVVVGLSISETTPIDGGSFDRGFDEAEVARLTRQIARDIMSEGGSLVLGHDWRPGGVMWDVLQFALDYQTSFSLWPGPAKLRNFIPWPDDLPLDEEQRGELKSVLAIEPGRLPARLQARAAQKLLQAEPDAKTYFRARGLTEMRKAMVKSCHARVCLGGCTGGSSGRYPGVVEEAYLTVACQAPLYVSRLLGGAAEHVVAAIERKSMPADFAATRADVKAVFDKFASRLEPGEPDASIDRNEVWKCFTDLGVAGLSKTNGLSSYENRSLFDARNVSDIRQWVLLGLSRLRSHRNV